MAGGKKRARTPKLALLGKKARKNSDDGMTDVKNEKLGRTIDASRKSGPKLAFAKPRGKNQGSEKTPDHTLKATITKRKKQGGGK